MSFLKLVILNSLTSKDCFTHDNTSRKSEGETYMLSGKSFYKELKSN
jgi:hypothetical protein